ncbi:LANO_0H13630g1_1 [Lachancea nothofagi CBS 11611]|uniref:LANO_0H13630g1_1 n=1 Tax=Lachancea nothofagi CBS 11611 TaxID=1266666 RepID=A0A1G4KMD1_9SACH|nr:LANO_0H13630g1_1 [Lachancea nothofagi CBS 11611]
MCYRISIVDEVYVKNSTIAKEIRYLKLYLEGPCPRPSPRLISSLSNVLSGAQVRSSHRSRLETGASSISARFKRRASGKPAVASLRPPCVLKRPAHHVSYYRRSCASMIVLSFSEYCLTTHSSVCCSSLEILSRIDSSQGDTLVYSDDITRPIQAIGAAGKHRHGGDCTVKLITQKLLQRQCSTLPGRWLNMFFLFILH